MTKLRLWMMPVLISFLIGFFTPLDVLEYTIPLTIVNIAEAFIPMINKLNGQYAHVQLVKFYGS
jgi:hypothetical protein